MIQWENSSISIDTLLQLRGEVVDLISQIDAKREAERTAEERFTQEMRLEKEVNKNRKVRASDRVILEWFQRVKTKARLIKGRVTTRQNGARK